MLDPDVERSLRLLEDTGFRPPSAVQLVVASPLCYFFRAITRIIPARWLIDAATARARTTQAKVAVWAYGGAYFYAERLAGRL